MDELVLYESAQAVPIFIVRYDDSIAGILLFRSFSFSFLPEISNTKINKLVPVSSTSISTSTSNPIPSPTSQIGATPTPSPVGASAISRAAFEQLEPDDLIEYLRKQGFNQIDEVSDVIIAQDIDGEVLATATVEELMKSGVSMGTAKKMLNRVPKE